MTDLRRKKNLRLLQILLSFGVSSSFCARAQSFKCFKQAKFWTSSKVLAGGGQTLLKGSDSFYVTNLFKAPQKETVFYHLQNPRIFLQIKRDVFVSSGTDPPLV